MRLAQARNYEVTERSFTSGRQKTLGVSEEMIGMITSMLTIFYQNPEYATARELLANGLDACIEADVEPRIEVTTSGSLSSTAEVVFRDYGVGMTPFIFEEIFAAYGESTKRESDDLTGGFGLGCKTPYTMSDTFTVITERDGKKVLGIFTRNENDLGVADFMDLGATDSTGTTITIPLSRNNLRSMEQAVQRAAFALPSGAVTLNGTVCASIHDDAFQLGEYGYVFNQRFDFLSNWNVLMGGIIYPLDNIDFQPEHNRRWGRWNRMGGTVVLFAGVDELLPTPQRDQLRDIQVNRDRIKAKYESIKNDALGYMNTYFSENFTHLEAIEEVREHGNWFTMVTEQSLREVAKWNGKSLSDVIELTDKTVFSKKYRKNLDTGKNMSSAAVRGGRVFGYVGMPAGCLNDRKFILHYNAKAKQFDQAVHFILLEEDEVFSQHWFVAGGDESQIELITAEEVYAVRPRPRGQRSQVAYQTTYTVREFDASGEYVARDISLAEMPDDVVYIKASEDSWRAAPAVIPEFFAGKKILVLRNGQDCGVMLRRLPDIEDIADQVTAAVENHVYNVVNDNVLHRWAKDIIRTNMQHYNNTNFRDTLNCLSEMLPNSGLTKTFTEYYTAPEWDMPENIAQVKSMLYRHPVYTQRMGEVELIVNEHDLRKQYPLIGSGWSQHYNNGLSKEKFLAHAKAYVEAIESGKD